MISFHLLDHVSEILAKQLALDEFFDQYQIDKDNDIRLFLNTRLQLLIRSLNVSSLTKNDFIDRLLISEHNHLTKAFQKLQLPF